MPKFPRNVDQGRAVRAFERAGGVEIGRRGKRSHRVVVMPNGVRLTLQYGVVPVGALAAMVKQADISVDDFISYLSESEMSVSYTVLVYENEPDELPGYWATVAELPGCFTHGTSVDEIRENVKDAIDAWFEGLEATGGEAPPPVAEKLEVVVG